MVHVVEAATYASMFPGAIAVNLGLLMNLFPADRGAGTFFAILLRVLPLLQCGGTALHFIVSISPPQCLNEPIGAALASLLPGVDRDN
jgi:hypothetical protein